MQQYIEQSDPIIRTLHLVEDHQGSQEAHLKDFQGEGDHPMEEEDHPMEEGDHPQEKSDEEESWMETPRKYFEAKGPKLSRSSPLESSTLELILPIQPSRAHTNEACYSSPIFKEIRWQNGYSQ